MAVRTLPNLIGEAMDAGPPGIDTDRHAAGGGGGRHECRSIASANGPAAERRIQNLAEKALSKCQHS
jgi:hypothetical protein